MKRILPALPLLLFLMLPAPAPGGEFQPYPGARLDETTTQAARQAASQSPLQVQEMVPTIYLTNDSFEKVTAFYRAQGREYKMPGQQDRALLKLPGGQEIKEAYFIFDRAPDLVASRSWVKVQRPFIGDVKMSGATPQYRDIREVTVINRWEGK